MNKKIFAKYIKSLPKNAKILDAGCGSGNNSRYVKKIRPDLDITALDINITKKKEIPSYAKFVRGSVEDLSYFNDNTFHCILCFHVLEHLHDNKKAVAEFMRVLKRGGIIFAESPHWITTITPIGFNFYDDPSHIRPHNESSFRRLFESFDIKYVKFETAIFIITIKNENRDD